MNWFFQVFDSPIFGNLNVSCPFCKKKCMMYVQDMTETAPVMTGQINRI